MATLPNTHKNDTTLSSSILLDDAQPNQPPCPAKGVKVFPTYHPRTGYLHLLAYAACDLVARLPTDGPGVSGSEARPVETPSPPLIRPPFLPITNNQDKNTSAHTSKSKVDTGLAPLSTSTPPPSKGPRQGPLVVRLRGCPQHPYKDSSSGEFCHHISFVCLISITDPVALRSSRKTKPKKGVSHIESSSKFRVQ